MRYSNLGWQMPGIAAAMFTELGFTPSVGAGLYQLASSPGLLAHAIEMSGKPITAMPFVGDSDYHFQWSEADD
jgi:citrate synthase